MHGVTELGTVGFTHSASPARAFRPAYAAGVRRRKP
jgi:hypothetical protein